MKTLRRIGLFIMQKWLIIPIIVAFILGVALIIPSFSRYPTRAEDGTAWSRDWEMLGTAMGVEAPGDGFRLLNNDTILGGDDTWYASWVWGEARDYTNARGEAVDLYPAQIYLLLYGCGDEALAREALKDWISREEATYLVNGRRDRVINAQPYDTMSYDCASEDNPYSRGISAFSTFGHYAVVVELTCTADYPGDEDAVLQRFLEGCHYSSNH